MFTLKQWKNITNTFSNSHTKGSGKITAEGSLVDNEDAFT